MQNLFLRLVYIFRFRPHNRVELSMDLLGIQVRPHTGSFQLFLNPGVGSFKSLWSNIIYGYNQQWSIIGKQNGVIKLWWFSLTRHLVTMVTQVMTLIGSHLGITFTSIKPLQEWKHSLIILHCMHNSTQMLKKCWHPSPPTHPSALPRESLDRLPHKTPLLIAFFHS